MELLFPELGLQVGVESRVQVQMVNLGCLSGYLCDDIGCMSLDFKGNTYLG